MSKPYPLPDDDFSSTGNDRPKYYTYQDFKDKYHIDIVPFIGERGKPTSIRFVLLEQPLHITKSLTNLIVSTPIFIEILKNKYELNLSNDLILVKDSFGYWDYLIDFINEYEFLGNPSKNLTLAKNNALDFFFFNEAQEENDEYLEF